MADHSINIFVRLINGVTAGAAGVKSALTRVAAMARSTFAGLREAGARVWDGLLNIKTLLISGALAGLVGKMFAEYAEAEEAEVRLRTAIRLRGKSVDDLLPKYKKLATAMQDQTVYTDEEVMAAQSLALSLGANAERMDEIIQAAVGMSATFGGDLASSIEKIIAVQNGVTRGWKRMGVDIDDTGNSTANYNTVLKAMGSLMDNATAQTLTLGGAWKQFKNQIGDVFEGIGGQVVKGGKLVEMLKSAKVRVGEMMDRLEKSGAIERWAARTRIALDKTLKLVEKVVGGTEPEREQAIAQLSEAGVNFASKVAQTLIPYGIEFGKNIAKGMWIAAKQGLNMGATPTPESRMESDRRKREMWEGAAAWLGFGTKLNAVDAMKQVESKARMRAEGHGPGGVNTGVRTVELLTDINEKMGKSQEGG